LIKLAGYSLRSILETTWLSNCGRLAPASSQAPTQLLAHSSACSGMGEKTARTGDGKLTGQNKHREITC